MAELETPDIGKVEAAYNVASPFGIYINNPSTRYTSDMREKGYNAWDDERFKDLDDETKLKVINAEGPRHFDAIVERNKVFQDSLDVLEDAPSWQSVPLQLGAAITGDPTVLIPGTAAFKFLKAANGITRTGKAFTVTGTIGAGSAVASESLFDMQELPTDYYTAAMLGFLVPGSIAGGLEVYGRAAYKSRLAENLNSRELETNVDTDVQSEIIYGTDAASTPVVKWTPDEEMGKLPTSIIAPKFIKSDVSTLYESKSNKVREFISKISPAAAAVYDKTGKAFTQKITAFDKKQQWKGKLNSTRLDIGMAYRDAKVDGTYKGSFDEFMQESNQYHKEVMMKQETDAHKYINEYEGKKTPEDIKQLTTEFYDDYKIELNHPNPAINRAVQRQIDYYKDMLDTAQGMQLKGLEGISKNKVYVPRVWDFQAIKRMDENRLKDIITRGIVTHPGNSDLLNPTDLQTVVNDLVTTMRSKSDALDFVDFSYIVPKEAPLATHLKQRKIKINDAEVQDLLINDGENIMGMYHYKQSGQMAVQWTFGRTNFDDIEVEDIGKVVDDEGKDTGKTKKVKRVEKGIRSEFIDKLKGEATTEEKAAMEAVFQDLAGTLRIPKNSDSLGWTASRYLTHWNSLTYGGSFGINTVAEIPVAMMATGAKSMFFKNFGSSVKAINQLLFQGKQADYKLANEFVAMGNLEQVFTTRGVNRFSDTDNVLNSSKLEHKLMGLSDSFFKWNGLRGITSLLESMVGGNAIMDIHKLGKQGKWSNKELDRLSRWGVDEDTAKRLSKKIDEYADFDGKKLKALNIDKWDADDLEVIQTAISRAIHSGVIQSDTMHLPRWMVVPDPVRRLVFQFLRYPIAANEIVLRRGLQEDVAGLAASSIGAMMAYGSMTYLREQAEIAVGTKDRIDAQYDVFNDGEEAWIRLMGKSSNYVAGFGGFTIPITYGSAVSGMPSFGKEYADHYSSVLGPSISRLKQANDILKPIFNDGEFDNTRQWMAAKQMVPLNNFPLLGEAWNHIIRENTY